MKTTLSLFLLLITPFGSNTVLANELEGFGRIGLLSHFIFRGNDFNDKSPVVQADYVVASDAGWWFGSFASNWRFQDRSEIEVDLLAGYDFQLAPEVSFKAAIVRYLFPDVGGHSTEWSLGVDIDDWAIKHHYDEHLKSHYSELNYSHPIDKSLLLKLHYGNFSNDMFSNQNDYEIKMSYQLKQSIELYAAFTNSDLSDNFIHGGIYLHF
jgi:uncharacterized protein (TIGR02001 family)